MIKKIIMWLLVILWMGLIFYFSSFDGEMSSRQSRGLLHNTFGYIIKIFDSDITELKKEELIEKLDKPVRKIAHASIYFVLAILVVLALNNYELNTKRIIYYSLVICILYACSDEIHQTFINERSAEVKDVIIDTFGSSIGIFLYNIFSKEREKI